MSDDRQAGGDHLHSGHGRKDEYADAAHAEAQRVSSQFAPDTGERLKRAARIFVVVLVVLFVLVGIERYLKARAVARATEAAANAPPLVDLVVAQAVGRLQRLVLPGYTAAWHASTIYARVDGYVGNWYSDIGDHVRGGQVLAVIETPDLDAELTAARAQLQASQATLLVRKAETELARTTYERWRDSPQGVVSEQEREEKKAGYDGAVARQKSAEAEVALAQAQVSKYEAFTQYKKVTAPYDGVITVREIDIGNLVTAGSTSATTALYVMTHNDPMRIFVDAPQSVADDLINTRAPVQVETNGGVARAYSGTVTRTAQAINLQARTLRVEVDVPNPKDEFVPGMYVKVSFALPPRGLVQVPAAALVFRSSGPQVARVDRTGHVAFRNVTIGRDDGSVVELSSGIAAGDHVALNIGGQISDGEQVRARMLGDGSSAALATAQR